MKTVILALLVLLVAAQTEGLRCFCGGTKKICPDSIETCRDSTNVCGRITITAGSSYSWSKGCIKARDCTTLNYSGLTSCTSCAFDLCNR